MVINRFGEIEINKLKNDKIGDLILDPFCGSGTTLRVAKELGRNAIGFEINSVYIDEMAEKDIEIRR